MSFLDEVIMNTKSALETIGKKANKVVDMSKLRIRQAELTKDLSKAYERTGKIVYDFNKRGLSYTDELSNQILVIDKICKDLENIKEDIKKAKEEVKSGSNSEQKSYQKDDKTSQKPNRQNLSELSNINFNNNNEAKSEDSTPETIEKPMEYTSQDIELNDEER